MVRENGEGDSVDSQGGCTVERSKEERRACASIGEKKRRERARAGMDQGVFCCCCCCRRRKISHSHALPLIHCHSLSDS